MADLFSTKPPPSERRNASVAALLTWFLPGAGHFMLGSYGLGLVFLLVVEGLYYAGLSLSGGMTFEFLDPELRSPLAPALSPEIGNLGGLLWQLKTYGFGTGIVRPWPPGIVLGSLLTGLSGVLNMIVMCHAHTLARAPSPAVANRTALVTLLAWLIPGLGHFQQGRRGRALVVFGLLVGCFVLGTVLAEGSNLSRERHFYYWAGQFGIGLPALLGELFFGSMRVTRDIPYVDGGLVFACVAGLLNILAMIDVYGWTEAKELGLPLKSSEHAGESATAAAPATGVNIRL